MLLPRELAGYWGFSDGWGEQISLYLPSWSYRMHIFFVHMSRQLLFSGRKISNFFCAVLEKNDCYNAHALEKDYNMFHVCLKLSRWWRRFMVLYWGTMHVVVDSLATHSLATGENRQATLSERLLCHYYIVRWTLNTIHIGILNGFGGEDHTITSENSMLLHFLAKFLNSRNLIATSRLILAFSFRLKNNINQITSVTDMARIGNKKCLLQISILNFKALKSSTTRSIRRNFHPEIFISKRNWDSVLCMDEVPNFVQFLHPLSGILSLCAFGTENSSMYVNSEKYHISTLLPFLRSLIALLHTTQKPGLFFIPRFASDHLRGLWRNLLQKDWIGYWKQCR